MTKQEMQNKLDRKDISGVGVKVTFDFSSGETGTTYYFYEDFEDDKGVDRAARHFADLINKGKIRKAEYIYSQPKRSTLERQPRDDLPALMMADQRMEEEGYDERNLCNLQQ